MPANFDTSQTPLDGGAWWIKLLFLYDIDGNAFMKFFNEWEGNEGL